MQRTSNMHAPEHDHRYEAAAIKAERQDVADNPDLSAAPAQAQHSPLPWHLSAYHQHKVVARSRGDATICDCTNPVFQDLREQEANARYIVRACNNVQRLADALAWLKREPHSLEAVGHAGWALAEWSKQQ